MQCKRAAISSRFLAPETIPRQIRQLRHVRGQPTRSRPDRQGRQNAYSSETAAKVSVFSLPTGTTLLFLIV
jgi:hypothetical protein